MIPLLRISILPAAVPSPAPTTELFVFLGCTLVCAALALVTGILAKRKVHLGAAALTVLSLALAIYFAEQVGRSWSFPEWPLRIHLVFAYLGTGLAVLVAITGVLRLSRKRSWVWHGKAVRAFLTVVVFALGTGAWIFVVGTPPQ